MCGEQIIYAYLSLLNHLRKKMLLFILRYGRPPPLGQILGRIPCRRSHFLMKQNVLASSSTQTHASPAGGPVPTQCGKKKSLLWQQNALRMSAFPNLKRFQDGPRLKGLSCGRRDNHCGAQRNQEHWVLKRSPSLPTHSRNIREGSGGS